MTHPPEELWIAVLTGTAGADELRAAAEHHASCANCAGLRRRLDEEQSAFRTALGRPHALPRRRAGSAIPALAAAALLVAALFFMIRPQPREIVPAAPTPPYRGFLGTMDGLTLQGDDGKKYALELDLDRTLTKLPPSGRVFVRVILEKDRFIVLHALPLKAGPRIEWDAGPRESAGIRRYGLAAKDGQKLLPGVWPLGVIPEDGRFAVTMPAVDGDALMPHLSIYAWLDSNDNGLADEPDRLFCLPSSVSSPK